MKGLFEELKRRHVYRVAVVYIVMSWLVLQVGDIVLGTFETPPWVMKALLALLVIGFPLAVTLAWAFELTPEGVRRTEPLNSPEARAPEDRRRVGRSLNIALGTALLAAMAFIGWQQLSTPGTVATRASDADAPADTRASIAVLPLANSSGDPAQEFFSDGLSEELIAGLSRIDALKVIGRSSSFQFKGSQTPGTEIGQKLGVDHLLEGSVRQQADRVRITVALVRAGDGSTLWTQTFDREVDDIFAVQTEISRAVASALRIELAVPDMALASFDQPPSGNVAAYKAYLQGRAQGRIDSEAAYQASIRHHREALRLDPAYAAAHLGLTLSLVNLVWYLPLEEAGRTFAEARTVAARAQQSAPGNPNTLLAEATVAMLEARYEDANRASARALALAPGDYTTHWSQALVFMNLGRSAEALEHLQRVVELEPLEPRPRIHAASMLLMLDRVDEAEQELRKSLDMDPRIPLASYYLADIAALRGDAQAIRKVAAEAFDADEKRYALALAHAVDGDAAAFESAIRTMLDECILPMGCEYGAFAAYAFSGQTDRMFTMLEKVAEHPMYNAGLLAEHMLRPYWHDPRFIAHLEKYNLSLPSPVSQPTRRR